MYRCLVREECTGKGEEGEGKLVFLRNLEAQSGPINWHSFSPSRIELHYLVVLERST